MVVEEAGAAGGVDLFEAGLEEGVVGDGEGELDDDDVAEGGAGDVHALPEAVAADEDAVGGLAELLEEAPAVAALALGEQGETVVGAEGVEGGGEAVHLAEAGAQEEGAALGLEEVLLDGRDGGVEKVELFLAGFGEVGFDEEANLGGVIEGAAQLEGLEAIEAEAGGEELEAGVVVTGRGGGAGGAEGGAGKDDGGEGVEQGFLEVGADVEGRGAEGEGGAGAAASGFDPIDGQRNALVEEAVEVGGEGAAACAIGGEFGLFLFVLGGLGEVMQAQAEGVEGGGEVIGEGGGLGEASGVGFGRAGVQEGEDAGEEGVGAGGGGEDEAPGVVVGAAVRGGDQALTGTGVKKAVEEEADLAVGEAEAEVFAGDGFEVVGFVEDGQGAAGQEGGAGLTEGEVAEEQGMVGDDEVGGVEPAAGLLIEAGGEAVAAAVGAGVLVGADGFPDGGGGREIEVAEGAVVGLEGPRAEAGEGVEVVGGVEEGGLSAAGLFVAAEAEVIGAALGEDGGEVQAGGAAEEGDVLVDKLLLEGDGVGGEEDLAFVLEGLLESGGEVGETFADAGAGLDDEVAVGGEGLSDGLGHVQLLGAWFVAGEVAGNGAFGAQQEGGVEGIFGLRGVLDQVRGPPGYRTVGAIVPSRGELAEA